MSYVLELATEIENAGKFPAYPVACYADRFDLESPSTNPGINSSIKQARAADEKASQKESK